MTNDAIEIDVVKLFALMSSNWYNCALELDEGDPARLELLAASHYLDLAADHLAMFKEYCDYDDGEDDDEGGGPEVGPAYEQDDIEAEKAFIRVSH